jgi:hypothetical protein
MMSVCSTQGSASPGLMWGIILWTQQVPHHAGEKGEVLQGMEGSRQSRVEPCSGRKNCQQRQAAHRCPERDDCHCGDDEAQLLVRRRRHAVQVYCRDAQHPVTAAK